jgi:cellulose synthase/poly-beta-1,6-N-acetylglucosamine synthase-like glycosyltransferase
MFEVIFIIALSFYFLQTVVLTIGAKKKFRKLESSALPSISILVAARNEENNIIDCLRSLDNLDYPDGKIQIIIIDDNSEDNTFQLTNDFIKSKKKFLLLETTEKIGELKGKTNAIANALRYASGEIILTTDADCRVSNSWAKTLASYYTDESIAMVFGYTNQFDNSNFEAAQSIDFLYVLGVGAGTMNMGLPLSGIGNNMSYRKSVYDEVGGYEAIPFSITEDSKLLNEISKLKKYNILFPLDAEGLVTSKACEDIKSVYWQKKRWGVGGLDTASSGAWLLASGFVTHVLLVLSIFFFSPLVAALAFFKFVVDYNFVRFLYSNLNLKLKLIHFLSFQIYFITYVIILPFILIFANKNIKWKGREYKETGK